MPSINGKKINELLDGSAVEDPLLLIGDQNGKAWNLGIHEVKDKLQKMTLGATNLALNTDIETVQAPGVYRIPYALYNNTNYPNAPYFPGMLLSTKLGDCYLVVEQSPGGVILQHMHIPFSDYAIFSRTLYPRHISITIRNWAITYGVGVFACEVNNAGVKSARSIQDFENVRYPGTYIFYTANTDTSRVDPGLLELYNLPVPRDMGLAFAGYNTLKVEYSAPDYDPNADPLNIRVGFKQTVFYGKLAIDSNIDMPSTFERIVSSIGGALTPRKWIDISNKGLASISINSVKANDNKLGAGTATIPPIVFTPGVQAQSPAVPGAWNYDGTDYYYTDSAGKKHKITSTIIT